MSQRQDLSRQRPLAAETRSRDALCALQEARFVEAVARAYASSGFLRDKLDRAGVSPGDVRGLEALWALPFTTKAEMRAAAPLGMLAVPRRELARVHASSGTTGRATVTLYTRGDLATWTELCARALAAAGIGPGSVVLVAYGYGLFTGGLAFQSAAEHLGALVIPASNVADAVRGRLMHELGATALLCTPSMAVTLAEALAAAGIAPDGGALEVGVMGGEAWSEALRARVEALWGIDAFDTYGLSEIIGPGVAHECAARGGLHLYEDHFVAEVVDPDTGRPVPDGTPGELVVTTLTREAQPMLRYRTGDLTALTREPCPCGRTFARIRKVAGRSDDMVVVGERRVLPTEVEDVLLEEPAVAPHYQIVRTPEARLVVCVEHARDLAVDMRALEARLARRLGERLGCASEVIAVAPGTLPRSVGKAARIATAPR